MYLRINGTEVSSYVKAGGLKWSRNDIDSENSGRKTMDVDMTRDRKGIKYKLEVTCRVLRQSEAEILLKEIEPEFVDVETISPRHGHVKWRMYCSTVPATHYHTNSSGEEMWDGIAFNLIQK